MTSTGSGLSVPDWPLSFGGFFPEMTGGVEYEHTHRMIAGTVGLMMLALTIWMWLREPRRWVRRLSLVALVVVILQAVLGGITVLYKLPTPVSVSHACLAQLFFCFAVTLALVTSPGWRKTIAGPDEGVDSRTAYRPTSPTEFSTLRSLLGITTGVIYMQLILGAWMRHAGAGLAIPDFPLALGRLIPPMDSPEVMIHFAHRVGAVAVTVFVVWSVARIVRKHQARVELYRPAVVLGGLLVMQLCFGAITVLSRKSVIPTTAHVGIGALILAAAVVLTIRSFRLAPITRKSKESMGLEPQLA